MTSQGKLPTQEVIGLIPAGGQATRIAPLTCSKELYPIGFRPIEEDLGARPKVVSHYLLEKMRFAGISKAYIVLRPGNWDIPAYFGDGSMLKMRLAYLMLGPPFGVPFTLTKPIRLCGMPRSHLVFQTFSLTLRTASSNYWPGKWRALPTLRSDFSRPNTHRQTIPSTSMITVAFGILSQGLP